MSSFNQTENIIQNWCITYQHGCGHGGSKFKNSFVIKAADVDMEKAKKIADILFPRWSGIEILAIEKDLNTLTPSEYDFIRGRLKAERQSIMRDQEIRIKDGVQEGPLKEDNYTEYLLKLINKMTDRMSQFPTYHT